MNISQSEIDDGIVMAELNGSLDVAGAAAADEYFAGLVGNSSKIIADLSSVDFVASAGIRVLVKTAKALSESGGKFAVLNPNDAARRIMWTTGLNNIVPIADDRQAAIDAVS